MRKLTEKKIWFILNTVVFFAWAVVFLYNTILQKNRELTTTFILEYCLYGMTFIIFGFNYFTKFRFYGYSIICMSWGIFAIYNNAGLIGFITFLTSYVFLWRLHFFSNKKSYLIFLTMFLPFITLILSKNCNYILHSLFQICAFLIILAICYFVLNPLYSKEGFASKKVLDLTGNGFSERDKLIVVKILAGEKYTAISEELNCSLSTINKDFSDICKRLEVADKTELLVKYSGCEII